MGVELTELPEAWGQALCLPPRPCTGQVNDIHSDTEGIAGLTHLPTAHSPVRLLHQEPPRRTLLAEDTAADGGDGVPDPRGNP